MKKGHFASLLLLVQCFVTATPPVLSHVEHESQDDILDSPWVKRSRVAEHTVLPVRIGLTQPNLDYGHDLLMQISDPTSERYGHHYSAEEVVDLFAPSQSSVDAVRDWLESSGIPRRRINISDNKQWVQFDAQAVELEGLLHTTYHRYYHVEDDSEAIACEKYHLPKDIQPFVDFVKPGLPGTFVSGGLNQKSHSRSVTAEESDNHVHTDMSARNMDDRRSGYAGHDCFEAVTPACIRKLYNVTDTIRKAPGNSIGLYSTQFQYYNGTDLDLFFKTYANQIKQGTRPKSRSIAGAPTLGNDKRGGSELDLDLQMMYPYVYPDQIMNFQVYDRYYQFYKHTPYGLFNVFLDALDGSYCNRTAFGVTGDTPKLDGKIPDPHKGGYKGDLQCGIYKPPKVISFSYGSVEFTLPVPYQRRMCQEFLKLSLMGTSLVFASGDDGVAPRACKKSSKGVFASNFPSCPYVTLVGGTRIPPRVPIKPGVEHAASRPSFFGGRAFFFSGGGFSNIFPRPSYQEVAVKRYLRNHNPPYPYYETKFTRYRPANMTGRYNRLGRACPDVAAIAQRTAVVFGRKKHLGYGTSASAPLFAGLIARINNHRLSAGKSTLGFLNPSLYHNPGMFNDVTTGHNPGCLQTQKGYNDGFRCAPGWDPVTGLGTPNYGKMLEYYMSLP